jgi:O-antigen/teichoic acid export membrane protein
MDRQGFVKHGAVYGFALLLGQAGSLLLLVLYTHNLHPGDFGILEVVGRLAETVGTILLFGGFRQALLTFYQQSETEGQRRNIVSTTLALFIVMAVLVGGPIFAFAEPIAGWLTRHLGNSNAVIDGHLLRLAVLGILLEPMVLIPLALTQARVESATFVFITFSQLIFRIVLVVVLVVWLGWGAYGVLAATAITSALYGIALSFREIGRGWSTPTLAQVRAFLRFALPFVPGGLCFFLLHHGDRFFLLRWYSADEVGRYALGYRLGMAVTTFSLTPLYMVWSARMYEVARTPAAPVSFGRAFTRILAAYLVVGLGLCLFQDELVQKMAREDFGGAQAVVPLIVLACFCQAAASLMDAAFYVRRRTGLKLGITLSATVVMLVLYVLLIPLYGSIGAALATLGGFLFLAAFTLKITQQIFPVRYEWPRLFALLGLTIGLWCLSRMLPIGGWAIPVKLGLWLVWPLVVWHAGLMSVDEKEHTIDLLRQLLGWFRRPLPSLRPASGPIEGAVEEPIPLVEAMAEEGPARVA